MRYVFWLVAVVSSLGFGKSASADWLLDLEATKHYRPVRYEDGIYVPPRPLQVVIPSEIKVLSGNAGNHLALLRLDETECVYKGGGKKALPLTNRSTTAEIQSGLAYKHLLCVPSIAELLRRLLSWKPLIPKPNDLIDVRKRIFVRVLDGDSTQSTKVRASLQVKGAPPTNEPALSLISPPNGAGTTNSYAFRIAGTVRAGVSEPSVRIARDPKLYPEQEDITAILNPTDGTFSADIDLLSGPNRYAISLYEKGLLKETVKAAIEYAPEGDAILKIGGSGGIVEARDPSSAIYGTRWEIPAGAATREFYAAIEDDREHWWALPQDLIQVGNGATYFPIGEEFARQTTFHLPVLPGLLPSGRSISEVEVYALDADPETSVHFWRKVPVTSRGGSFVSVSREKVDFYALVPVVNAVAAAGELKVVSTASATEIYLDGVPIRGDLPLTIKNVAPGMHEMKAFAPGYNEILRSFEFSPEGQLVKFEMMPAKGEVPLVLIDPSITEEMTVDQNIATIPGRIQNGPVGGFLVVSQNGFDSFAQVDEDGEFLHTVPLDRGLNQIVFRYTTPDGLTGVSRRLKIWNRPIDFNESSTSQTSGLRRSSIPIIPVRSKKKARLFSPKTSSRATSLSARTGETPSGKDIRITLTWNSATDMDLHVTDPLGRHASYEDHFGIPGGVLDVDDTDGYGPENFTLPNAPVGVYPIYIHHFDDYRRGPGIATLQVSLNGKVVFTQSSALGNEQVWHAFQLEVIESRIRIAEVGVPRSPSGSYASCYEYGLEGGNCYPYVFTTLAGENLIRARTEASSDIDPATIKYQVRNLMDGHPVNLTSGTGSTLVFPANNRGLSGLTSPPLSRPLVYEIRAYTDSGLSSDPVYVAQDIRSQIRQEFIDKRRYLGSSFIRETPAYATIGDGTIYGPSFLESPFNGASQHFAKYGLTIVRQSRTYFDRLKAAGIPVRLTSHWRNPRFNDSLGSSNGSEVNSYHQTGDAVDVNPHFEKNRWPSGAKTYDEAREILLDAAARLLSTETVMPHGNKVNLHIHIQPRR